MILNNDQISRILEDIAKTLDISPSDYQRAVDSYLAVGKWLQDGYEEAYPDSTTEPSIYLQGSMRLGTVVRPLRDGKDSNFDVDMVCELCAEKSETSPGVVKAQVGDRLKANATYCEKLDDEGKRCWTIEYVHIRDGIAA